jgi:hypothetical protein
MPVKAFMTATPFSVAETAQPAVGPFLLRMVGKVYHPGGQTSLFVAGVPTNTQPWVGIDGTMIATAQVDLPAGEHDLDIRYNIRFYLP